MASLFWGQERLAGCETVTVLFMAWRDSAPVHDSRGQRGRDERFILIFSFLSFFFFFFAAFPHRNNKKNLLHCDCLTCKHLLVEFLFEIIEMVWEKSLGDDEVSAFWASARDEWWHYCWFFHEKRFAQCYWIKHCRPVVGLCGKKCKRGTFLSQGSGI